MFKYLMIMIFTLMMMCSACSVAQNNILSQSLYTSGDLAITIHYYESKEEELVLKSIKWLNETLINVNPNEHLNGQIYIDFYKNMRINDWGLNGVAISIGEDEYRLNVITYDEFVKKFKISDHFSFEVGIIPDEEFIDIQYSSYVVHELMHCFLFSLEISNTAFHEYFAYSMQYAFIPTKYMDKMLPAMVEYVANEEYKTDDFINDRTYSQDPFRYGIVSYLHFVETDSQYLKLILTPMPTIGSE